MNKTRADVEIDNEYLRIIMDRYGIHTKTEAVDYALRIVAGQPMSREEVLAMHGARDR
jgi:Arc/MetJ family transcription regulator